MAFDAFFLSAVLEEVRTRCIGARVEKIHQPARDTIIVHLRCQEGREKLLFAANPTAPRLHLTAASPENPAQPPMFCMLLRKHLEEGRITKKTQSGLDRVITMEISSIGSARQIISKQLIFELTGKNANIIFVSEGVILDSLKHIGKALSSYRQILPGLAYIAPPPQDGLNILTSAPVDIAAAAQNQPLPPQKALIAATTGIGQYTAGQLLKFAGITAEGGITNENTAALADAIGT